jgi:tRNA(Ile)-lysidine synthase
MLDKFYTILQHKCQIVPGKTLLVGVSGGPDSLCLLDMLRRQGLPLVVAHFNHQLRSEASEDALQVQELARGMGLPFVSASMDVATFAQANSLSIEEAARELRYRFLFKEARRARAQAVAVGHTADDQVETVLMHLLRGAGLDGLLGMPYRLLPNPWDAHIPLVRPLLDTWREEVQAYISGRGLQPVQDASNLEVTYYRNRLRHEVIPYLERRNPHVRQLLWRTAGILREEASLLDGLAQASWRACCLEQGSDCVALDEAAFAGQAVALQRRVLRQAVAALRPGLRDVDYEAIERGRGFLLDPKRMGQCSLVGGLFLLREAGRVWLASWEAELPSAGWPQLPSDEPQALYIPGELLLPGGWALVAGDLLAIDGVRHLVHANPDPFQAWLDAAALPGPLVVRRRRSGDRLQPLGMAGHSVKISDLMVNLRIPQRLRLAWPLVCAGDEIVWVPGCRQSMLGRVRAETGRVVCLSLKKSEIGA